MLLFPSRCSLSLHWPGALDGGEVDPIRGDAPTLTSRDPGSSARHLPSRAASLSCKCKICLRQLVTGGASFGVPRFVSERVFSKEGAGFSPPRPSVCLIFHSEPTWQVLLCLALAPVPFQGFQLSGGTAFHASLLHQGRRLKGGDLILLRAKRHFPSALTLLRGYNVMPGFTTKL